MTLDRAGSYSGGRRENLVRFSQIGRVLVRHGFGFVFDVRRDRRERRGIEELLAPNFAVRLRRALDDLGTAAELFSSQGDEVNAERARAVMRALQAI